MNAKQAFEEAAAWSVNKDDEAAGQGRMERAGAHADANDHFTRRAAEVEAEDAAWTAEVRRLALIVRDAKPGAHPFRDARDASLLAILVLNVVGEKP